MHDTDTPSTPSTPSTPTPYKTPTKERDTADLVALARGRIRLTRCPGGRITDNGFSNSPAPDYIYCAHCGIELTDVTNADFCGQPLDADGFTPFDTTVARRLLTRGGNCHD